VNPVQIPGYELLGKLGEGGMAAVWKARQIKLNRLVAVKILRPRLTERPEERERFRHEALATATLSHPNIVQVIDAGECDGRAYTVMEYVPGCTLADWLDTRPRLPERQVLDIASDLAAALAYGWNQHRMVHCDIKPDNVLLHEAGSVKLSDFGIAQMAGFTDIPVEAEFALGTPHYMSPEQATRDRRQLDCRADIYSLGATLYHALTGLMPFQGHPLEQVLEQQVTGYLPDLAEIVPELDPACAWLVEKMMARDPGLRQQTWEEVLADLERARAGTLVDRPLAQGGLSTVRRHPHRRRPPEGSAPPAAARARSFPRLSLGDLGQIRRLHDRREGGLPQARAAATALGALTLIAYAYTALFTTRVHGVARPTAPVDDLLAHAAPAPETPPPPPVVVPGAAAQQAFLDTLKALETPAAARDADHPHLATRSPAPPPPSVSDAASPGEVAPAPPPVPAEPEPPPPPAEWRDPTYLQAKQLLAGARQQYAAALHDRQNRARWHALENDLRSAQTLLQGLRIHAPPEAGVGDLLRDVNKLLFDAHQVMRVLE
jgi:hypothetical protein